MNTSFEAFFTIGVALLLIFVCLPLALRKVRMNHLYGFRTAAAFKSESQWYDINAAGGRIVIYSTLPILVIGICKLFTPQDVFIYLNLSALAFPLLICWFLSRRTGQKT